MKLFSPVNDGSLQLHADIQNRPGHLIYKAGLNPNFI